MNPITPHGAMLVLKKLDKLEESGIREVDLTVSVYNGPRPLKSTWRHGPFWGLVTCDMGFKKIVTWDMGISQIRQGDMTIS